MENLKILVIVLLFSSCRNGTSSIDRFNNLKSPVILFGKLEYPICGCYGVELIDGNRNIHSFDSSTQTARSIGQNYEVGDTLK